MVSESGIFWMQMNSSTSSDDNKTFSVEDIGTQQYFIAMVEIIMCYKMMEIVHKNKVSYKPCRSISSVV